MGNRNTNKLKLPPKMPIYAEKCDMCTLLENAAIAYSHKTDMLNQLEQVHAL